MPMELGDEAELLFRSAEVNVIYGMSEAGGSVTVDFPRSRNDSAGKLVSGLSVKILDSSGNRCEADVDGEVCFKSTFLFTQYYRNEAATFECFDSEGFFHTGDIGHFDALGHFYFVDRKKELIKYLNYQISPSEIENFLVGLEGVKMACVVGVPESLTELPAVLIVRSSDGLLVDQIHREMKGNCFDFSFRLLQLLDFVLFKQTFRTTNNCVGESTSSTTCP